MSKYKLAVPMRNVIFFFSELFALQCRQRQTPLLSEHLYKNLERPGLRLWSNKHPRPIHGCRITSPPVNKTRDISWKNVNQTTTGNNYYPYYWMTILEYARCFSFRRMKRFNQKFKRGPRCELNTQPGRSGSTLRKYESSFFGSIQIECCKH